MLDRFTPWRKDVPAPRNRPRATPAELARLRVGTWVEFKRLHLGFAQALNAVTYGHSSTLALVRHAMLAEYEARRLLGQADPPGPDLTQGEAMRQALIRCRSVYGRVNASAFDEKALAGIAEEADAHLIALMLNLTTAPFRTADNAVIAEAARRALEEAGRAVRFTPEITKLHKRLRAHFADLARRAGLA
ncbi:MAG: hypothetical protein ACLFQ5_02655 [Oceanicaulis sp.]